MNPMERYNELKEKLCPIDNKIDDRVTVTVQMGICSQAAGVMEVMQALKDTVIRQGFNVSISKTGCGGFCAYEPMITIDRKGVKPVTYCRVTPEKAKVILSEYMLKNRIIESWTLNGKDVTL